MAAGVLLLLGVLWRSAISLPAESVPEVVIDYANSLANPEELGVHAEGDIAPSRGSERNGVVDEGKRWRDGVIPYVIDKAAGEDFEKIIKRAMYEYAKYTCIRFRERTPSDRDYVVIRSEKSGCWSHIGRIGGAQQVNLQHPACTSRIGTPIHELMHVVGFAHEQNRWERDNHVAVRWENIKRGMESNFKKYPKGEVSGYSVPYDYGSVMHYSKYAFTKNNRPTIVPKVGGAVIGQREGFSKADVRKINAMYKCDANNNNSNNGVDKENESPGGGLFSFINNIFQ